MASLGGLLNVPPHGDFTTLTVTAALRIEELPFGGGAIPGTALSLLHVLKGDGSLPLRGMAVGWCRASLKLHGSQSSSGTGIEFVSAGVNRDGADSKDNAPGGVIRLSKTVGLGAGTRSLSVFVDVQCFAGAEEGDGRLHSAFSLFECRNKPVTEVTGVYVPPSRIRLQQVTARICEVPVVTKQAVMQ
jgi:hypothetical protein